jgi:hypothetical protein
MPEVEIYSNVNRAKWLLHALLVVQWLLLPALQGYLLPAYHKFYWFGLNTSDGTQWHQQDRTISTSYRSWGIFKHGSGNLPEREPNNYIDPEYCAGCNYTELITGKLPVWGWSDEQCQLTYPVMCRSIGECAHGITPAPHRPICQLCQLPLARAAPCNLAVRLAS